MIRGRSSTDPGFILRTSWINTAWRWKYKPSCVSRVCELDTVCLLNRGRSIGGSNVSLFCPLNQHPRFELHVLNQRTSCEPATHSVRVCFLLPDHIAGKLAASRTSSDIMEQPVSATGCVFMCGLSGGGYTHLTLRLPHL